MQFWPIFSPSKKISEKKVFDSFCKISTRSHPLWRNFSKFRRYRRERAHANVINFKKNIVCLTEFWLIFSDIFRVSFAVFPLPRPPPSVGSLLSKFLVQSSNLKTSLLHDFAQFFQEKTSKNDDFCRLPLSIYTSLIHHVVLKHSRAKKSGPHSRHKEAVSSQILIDFKVWNNIWYDLDLISDFISNFEIDQNFAWNRLFMSNN